MENGSGSRLFHLLPCYKVGYDLRYPMYLTHIVISEEVTKVGSKVANGE
jgi:hypothetical protein